MKVKCFTALDRGKNADWPTEMAARPIIGDFVVAGNGLRLRVVDVCHMMCPSHDPIASHEAMLRVELHLPEGMTISQWEVRS